MENWYCNWVIFQIRLELTCYRSSHRGLVVMNLTSIHEDTGLIPGLIQWLKGSGIAMSYDVGRRCSSDTLRLWLWLQLAATVSIQHLAWELPYATGAALKRQKTKNNPQNKNKTGINLLHISRSFIARNCNHL